MAETNSPVARISVRQAEGEFVDPDVNIKRPWTQRTFSKMNPGSIRASIFTLVSTAIGLGMLTLPYAIQQLGLVTGLVLLIANAFVSCWTMNILLTACNIADAKTYSQLMGRIFGFKFGITTDICQYFYGLGIMISYICALGEMVLNLSDAFGYIPHDETQAEVKDRIRFWAMVSVVVVSIPITAIRRVSALATAGLISLFPFMALVAYVLITGPGAIQNNFFPSDGSAPKEINWYNATEAFAKANCIFLFAYMLHLNVVPVGDEMSQRTAKRIEKVTSRTTTSLIFLYLPVGVLGYLSFPDSTKDTFISNIDGKSLFSILLQFGLFYSILISIPLNGITTVNNFKNVLKAFKHPEVAKLAFEVQGDLKEKVDKQLRQTLRIRDSTMNGELMDLNADLLAKTPVVADEKAQEVVETTTQEETQDYAALSPRLETTWFRMLAAAISLFIAFLVAYTTSSVTDVLGIVSGVLSTLMMLFMPMLVYRAMLADRDSAPVRHAKIIFMTVYSLMSFSSVGWQIHVLMK